MTSSNGFRERAMGLWLTANEVPNQLRRAAAADKVDDLRQRRRPQADSFMGGLGRPRGELRPDCRGRKPEGDPRKEDGNA
jgi:hypothetical protein